MTLALLRRAWLAPLLTGLALLPLAASAATTGSGRSATESRSLPAFEAVAVAGGIDLRLSQGAGPVVEVTADDNLLPLLETVVESGRHGVTLKVGFKRGERISTRSKALVTVVVPTLKAVSAAGAGDIAIGRFETSALQVSVAGSGEIRLDDLSTGELGIGIAGSGSVDGRGKATSLRISIAGSGDVKLGEMPAEAVTVKIAGSGDAQVHATKTLDVSIAGSGDVRYRGDAVLKKSIMGSGNIQRH